MYLFLSIRQLWRSIFFPTRWVSDTLNKDLLLLHVHVNVYVCFYAHAIEGLPLLYMNSENALCCTEYRIGPPSNIATVYIKKLYSLTNMLRYDKAAATQTIA